MYYQTKTARLLMRPLNMGDLEEVHDFSSDPANTMYMEYLPNETVQETNTFLQNVSYEWTKDEPYYFEFALELNRELMGEVSVYLNESRDVGELSVIIHRAYWRNGLATEGLLAVKEFALNVLGLKKIIGRCDYRNTIAAHLMEKIGMHLEDDTGTRTYLGEAEPVPELTYSLSV